MKVRSKGSKKYSNLGSNPSRIWQNLVEFYGLAEYSKVQQKQQIVIDCGKLQSHTQSLFAKLVETGKYI